jgi:ribosome-associated protein
LTDRLPAPGLAALVAELAADRKAADIVTLDLRDSSSVTDFFVISTGRSDVHVRAIVERIEQGLAERGERPLAREGVAHGVWALIDYGDVVVHVFQPDTRAFYQLERLWAHAPRWTGGTSSVIQAGRT